MKRFLILVLASLPFLLRAQIPPEIIDVNPAVVFPGEHIVISGSGFSTNPAEIEVWFGGIKGEVVIAEETIIEAIVPVSAEADNITVIHKGKKLSAKSQIKVVSKFSGSDFSINNFSDPITFSETLQLFDVCVCDFNIDGKPDLAVSKLNGATNSVRIFMNQSTPGNIVFMPLTNNPPIIGPTADLKCADLNSDGYPDLVATKGGVGGVDRNAIYYFENVNGVLGQAVALLMPSADVTTENINIRDLNFDGKPDLIVSNSKSNIIFSFINTSSGSISFNNTPQKIVLVGRDATRGLDIQDLNGDKRPEIIIAAQSGLTSDIVVLPNESTANSLIFGAPITYQVGEVLQGDIVSGDFNGDGLIDIAAASPFSNKLILLKNTSSNNLVTFDNPKSLNLGGIFGLDIIDINGDGKLDIIGTDTKGNYVPALINKSTETSIDFDVRNIATDFPSRNIAANDFDGDSKPDLAYTTEGNNVYYFNIRRNENCYNPVLIDETPQKICPGQSVTANVVPSAGSTFTWFMDGTQVGTSTDPFFTFTGTGTATVSVSQENGNCISTSTNNVVFEDGTGTVPGDPTADNSGIACIGDDITLTASEVAGAVYLWTGPNNFTSNLRSPVLTGVTPETAGLYRLSITLGECRSSIVSTVVEVYSFPTFVIESSKGDGFCEGESSTLSVSSLTGFSYSWTGASGNTVLSTTPTLDITEAGTFKVRITYDLLGCWTEVDPVEVKTTSLPIVNFTPSKLTICAGESIIFDNSTTFDTQNTITYNWDFGDANISTEENPQHIYAALGTYTVVLSADYLGFDNCGGSKEISVSVTDALLPSISADETAICEGEEQTELIVNGNFPGGIIWNNGESGANLTVDKAGVYSIETIDQNGCPGSAEIEITGLARPELVVSQDTVINLGDTVRLFASGADTYEWFTIDGPEETLDDNFSESPLVETGETTMYEIIGFSTDLCTDTAYVTVTIRSSGVINVQPKAFLSPATKDGINDTWIIDRIRWYSDCTVTIFDRRGIPVFETAAYNNEWDGTMNGNELPEGVYYYLITCPNNLELRPKKGTVLLIK